MSTVDLLRADALQPLLDQIGNAAQSADARATNAATSAAQAGTHAQSALGHRTAAETAAQSAAQSALAAQGAGGGGGAAGGSVHARIEAGLSSPGSVWAAVSFLAKQTTGAAWIQDNPLDGPSVQFPSGPGPGTAVFEIDLGALPLLVNPAVAVHARALGSPEEFPASLLVEPLDSAGRPVRSVQAARTAFRGHGIQTFAAEGVSLYEETGETDVFGNAILRRAARLRVTFAARCAEGAIVGGTFFRMSAQPFLRPVIPEVTAMEGEKADKLASRMQALGGGANLPLVLAHESRTEFFVTGAGTTTLPGGIEGTVLYVWHDADSGTVTLAAPSGMTLRGSAAMSARGQMRRCVRRGTVWYVH